MISLKEFLKEKIDMNMKIPVILLLKILHEEEKNEGNFKYVVNLLFY